MTELSKRLIQEIQAVPPGQVASYGQIARLAGSPGASRQVARILHSSSSRYNLPWHRIVGSGGHIKLPPGGKLEEQVLRLQAEGVEVSISRNGNQARVNMAQHNYSPAGTPPPSSSTTDTPALTVELSGDNMSS